MTIIDRQHQHDFVEKYTGLLAQGLDRETDLATVQVYLQKLSDDKMMETLLPRLSDDDVINIFDFINKILRRHLSEGEYHNIFLRDFPQGPRQL